MKTAVYAAMALVCGSVWAEPVLQNVVGSVQVNARAAKVGDPVPAGASIQTGGGSRAEVRFDDGHLIALGASTQFQLRQYAYNKAEPAKDSIVLNLLVGTLRSITGALGARNPGKFSLTTPTATAGIRGTDFGAAVVPAQATASWSAGGVQVAGLGDVPLGLDPGVWTSSPLQLAQLPLPPSVFFTVNTGSIGVATSASSAIMGAGQALAVGAGGSLSFVSAAVLPSGLSSIMSTPLASGAAGAGAQGGASAGQAGSGTAGASSGGAGAGAGSAGAGAGAAGATTAAAGGVTGATVAAGVVAAGVVAATVSSTTGTSGTTGTTSSTNSN